MTQNWKQFIQQFPISTPSAKILVDLSHFGVIKVSGPDAAKFLQGQLTCDVIALESGDQSFGAYCNIKGKVESLFRLWRLGEDYYLRMQEGLVEQTLEELQKYGIFSKVALQNVTGKICGFGVYNHKVHVELYDPQIAILEIKSQQRYEIFGPVKELEKAWHTCIQHAVHVDPEMWEQLDIADQIPEIYPQTVNEFFAHDLNLPNLDAVSFTKGCFRGQEIIARMQNRGKMKRHLCQFSAPDIRIKPGDLISAGGPEVETTAGNVVRAGIGREGSIIGLAVVTDATTAQKLFIRNMPITLA